MAIVERPETASLIDFEQPDTTAVLEALPIMVSYFDRDLRYRYVNRRYLDVYSCSHNAIIGKRMPDLIGPEIFEQVRPYIEKALRGEVVRHKQRLTFGALDERDHQVLPHEELLGCLPRGPRLRGAGPQRPLHGLHERPDPALRGEG